MKHTQSRNRGATLLIAVLMTSVILAVGMGIYQRTYKSLVFSSYWKQTQIAFAAADAGIECAFYLDSHPTAFKTCFGKSGTELDSYSTTSTWILGSEVELKDIEIPDLMGCVDISIKKLATYTSIKSRGHNTCDVTNPRRVERALELRY